MRRAHGRPFRMLALLSIVTAVVSAFLDNVTTVLLMAPVTLEITRRLEQDASLYLISEAVASNIGGAATLIGDPPNIMIASKAQLDFADFIVVLAPLAVLAMAGVLALFWVLWRHRLRVDEQRWLSAMALDSDAAIQDPVMLRSGLWLLALTIAGFFFHRLLQLEPATIALLGASLFMVWGHRRNLHATGARGGGELTSLMEVEWETILFFVGLFILVGGLVKSGVIRLVADELITVTQGSAAATTMAVLWGSAFLSAIVDNIPYVAAMNPMIVELARATHPGVQDYITLVHQPDIVPLWWALAAGACFGGNGTLIGASANVIVVDQAQRAGVIISFGRFFLYGFPAMILTLLISTAYFWLVFF
jgi:Na+/H+ antiporter NhaD/arsenite permease-like protein